MTFYENLTLACASKGFTVTSSLKQAGLSTSKSTQWKRGARPAIEDIKKIADVIGVNSLELLDWEKSEQKEKAAPALSEDSLELLKVFDQLTPDMKKVAIAQARALLEARR